MYCSVRGIMMISSEGQMTVKDVHYDRYGYNFDIKEHLFVRFIVLNI